MFSVNTKDNKSTIISANVQNDVTILFESESSDPRLKQPVPDPLYP